MLGTYPSELLHLPINKIAKRKDVANLNRKISTEFSGKNSNLPPEVSKNDVSLMLVLICFK